MTPNSTPYLGARADLGGRKCYQSKSRPHMPIRLLCTLHMLSFTAWPQYTTRQTERQIYDRVIGIGRLCYSIGGLKSVSVVFAVGWRQDVGCTELVRYLPFPAEGARRRLILCSRYRRVVTMNFDKRWSTKWSVSQSLDSKELTPQIRDTPLDLCALYKLNYYYYYYNYNPVTPERHWGQCLI